MTRGFHIWSQNLNLTTFGHLWPKIAKMAKNWMLPVFDHFFGPKGGQMLSDLNFETRSGIISSFAEYMTHFC